MLTIPNKPYTEDAPAFDPQRFLSTWTKSQPTAPVDNDFRQFMIAIFDLPSDDSYRYVATAEVSLQQVQAHINHGAQGGFHAWYRDQDNQSRGNPSLSDIVAYVDIFRSTTNTSKALTALGSNAKKDSLRADVARHLSALYHPCPRYTVNKRKNHVNPYFDVWAWSCQNLEWGGPEEGTVRVKTSHAILPVLYHHFGCVVPSYESLQLIHAFARNRRILDVGSGNGYWTFMLRNLEVPGSSKSKQLSDVVPIDNGSSRWRTLWVGDTVQADGVQWLKKNDGGKEDVLLLVYPIVGNDFTRQIIKAYRGTTIISAGAQNCSGFTAFAKETIGQWMAREMPEWSLESQIPLPSFAGKDEALFIFEKKVKE